MKSYYDFMFFSAVCSSFKGFKCVIKNWKTQKKAGNLSEQKNSSKIYQPRKIRFGQISNPKKIGQASLSKL